MNLLLVALSTLAVLFTAAPGHAEVKEAQVRKLWEKFVKPSSEKPKLACICLANNELGAMVSYGIPIDSATCSVPRFQNGILAQYTVCQDDWVILRK